MYGFLSHHIYGYIVFNIKENKNNIKRKDLFLFYFYLQLMKKAGLNLSVRVSQCIFIQICQHAKQGENDTIMFHSYIN